MLANTWSFTGNGLSGMEENELGVASDEISREVLALIKGQAGRVPKTDKAWLRKISEIVDRHVHAAYLEIRSRRRERLGRATTN